MAVSDEATWPILALIIAIVAFAIYTAFDAPGAETNLPPEPAVYRHPEGP